MGITDEIYKLITYLHVSVDIGGWFSCWLMIIFDSFDPFILIFDPENVVESGTTPNNKTGILTY